MSGTSKVVIRGRTYEAVCAGKPEHTQGVAKLVALVNDKGKVVWGKK